MARPKLSFKRIRFPSISRAALIRNIGNAFFAIGFLIIVGGVFAVLWFVFVRSQEQPEVSVPPMPSVNREDLDALVNELNRRNEEHPKTPLIPTRNPFQ
ncbi:MAG: hypothetical protein A2806_04715 [Candidatus Terrybacteria bacterium RIFCSPHIGHO2_01_FULL_48_17]|uniref:Uncharacterized protein n=1 Tax=Candidatus Terrybacteria bacterium RIFCSPHIGHO2_01_FULL_48_17 TaxID=1802362 RepID=A0A1G2PL17_9BACT|nr:MAG: hypothetical protein A2806_04715 [Candidatus Terrybacteria bacterium RIFCSPHIGHO2_01_FULL_48_17]OHA52091.1 MAG: hypothetical protein A3A30_04270 [Candidatus Terrybacteria bacterium RIFCSPLOWO2_01_FULL_48_14]